MVKLDVSLLRYLSGEDFKVLTSVEMGMRNHELVPGTLVNSIATLRFGGCGKVLVDLTKHKLLAYERGKRYDGYRLTYAGYDYLALNALTHREILGGVGNQIGVGKESDVFICESADQQYQYAIKFHRLGRVCFRKVSEKRDFYTKSKNKTSWIYLSRIAAQREYEFLRFMHCKGMPVPKPIDCNRHVVVMELIDGRILNHYTLESFESETRDEQIAALYNKLIGLIFKFANELRVIHGDFNEFNILIKHDPVTNELEPVIIDLPQMIGVDHELAPDQFERDVNCIVEFFNKRFHYESDYVPKWSDIDEHAKEENKMDKFLLDALNAIEDDDDNNKEVKKQIDEHDVIGIKTPSSNTIHNDDDDDDDNDEHDSVDQPNKGSITTKRISSEDKPSTDLNDPREHAIVDEIDDCASQFTTMTVDPELARQRIRAEIIKKENNKKRRQAAKPKNIKGDANPVKRKRKVNQYIACEDEAAYSECF
uniref:Serine/threonine-protein kinase RIO2 n=1 Tax=Aceria tosichella TaxID=561515 RepID=A0A6G1SL65_9ACAR